MGAPIPPRSHLIPSQSWLGMGPGAPIPPRSCPIPVPVLAWHESGSSHPTEIWSHPGPTKKNLVPSHPDLIPGWDQDGMEAPGLVPRILLFYNIHTNIRSIQSMNISLESVHQEL